MPRAVREANLSTKEARGRLAVRHKPYYRALDAGLHLGYRKSQSGSAWVIRWYEGEGAYRIANLDGRPDDVLAADGEAVLNWNQAQGKARTLFVRRQREGLGLRADAGPYLVSDALSDYLTAYERRGGKAKDRVQAIINAHIPPAFAAHNVDRLRRSQLESWFHGLAEKGQRVRVKKGDDAKYRAAPQTDEEHRRRRATANRCLTVIKAALNQAYQAGKVASADAWMTVKPYRNVDNPIVRYLSDAEAKRLVNACSSEFKPLVQAALLTGCRYGDLRTLRVRFFNADAGTITIPTGKGNKRRHVYLTDEGARFFSRVTAGKQGDALVFTREGGEAWGKSHQHRPMVAACRTARIKPAVRFHDLRHTTGSLLAMQGVPLTVIAAQLGHADTRMTERHYAHLSPNYVADTIRQHFPNLGIVPKSNVRSLGGKR